MTCKTVSDPVGSVGSVGSVGCALWALGTNTGIHKMVESAYKVTLVVAFTPLVAGLYWSRATAQGAYLGIGFGLVTWLLLE